MTAADWTVRAESLSKKFGLTLRQSMMYGVKDSLRRLLGVDDHTDRLRPGEFWAVKDASFQVRRGEGLGIMGENGSGKTTLLRVLNGVFAPDEGRVSLRGRVGALIAAGAGFAPMLTGRENVYVNGALLGMSRHEIDARMNEIIAFADVGQFIDTAVKHYSSGMFVRLGFAIAAMSEPEILLVDEVLAVGDLNFQKKCYDYLHRLKRNGTSIILVSHSIGAIWALCERGLFMHEGRVLVSGSAEDIIRAYNDQNARAGLGRSASGTGATAAHDETLSGDYSGRRGGTGDVIVHTVSILAAASESPTRTVRFGGPFAIEATFEVKAPIETPLIRFTVDAVHYKFIASLDSHEQGLRLAALEPGAYRLRVDVPSQNLMPGAYTVNVGISRKGFGGHLFFWFAPCCFQVLQPEDKFLYSEDKAVLHLTGHFALCADADRDSPGCRSTTGDQGLALPGSSGE
jgi:lipopolysaccharide transport system ATP-binding protein